MLESLLKNSRNTVILRSTIKNISSEFLTDEMEIFRGFLVHEGNILVDMCIGEFFCRKPAPNCYLLHLECLSGHAVSPTYWLKGRDVPDIHPVPGKCRVSHYSVLPGPGKIMGRVIKKNFFLNFFFYLRY